MPGSATLTPQGKQEPDKVVDYLKLYPELTIRLSGHTDNVGTDATNPLRSERRSESAKEYIASRSIARSRITTEWHGSAQPTIGNGAPAGRAKNRQVEVIVGSPKPVDRS